MDARALLSALPFLIVPLALHVCDDQAAPPALSATQLPDGVAYAVAVTGGRAALDLPADGSRYVLIVSNLGDAAVSRSVRLSSHPVASADPLQVVPVDPLRIESPGPMPHWSRNKTDISGAKEAASPERIFYLHVTDGSLNDPRHYAAVRSRCIFEGRQVRVYLDGQLKAEQVASGLPEEIVRCLDEDIIPCARRALGNYSDVDRDGKFAVLLTPWLGRLQGGRTSLGGCVKGSDFRTDLPAPLSNRADVMYLNSNLRPGRHLTTLLAHEFTHAVSFSARRMRQGWTTIPEEEDWLNEAVAHLGENLHGAGWSNLDYRVSAFLSDPAAYPLAVEDYYRSGLWRSPGCRGATYLFLRWCVDSFGEGVLPRLIHSPLRGRDNIAWATGVPFPELYRRWSIAVFQSGRRHASSAGCDLSRHYRTVDLYGTLGAWALAGPRAVQWQAGAEPLKLSLPGTTTAYILLEIPQAAAPQRVTVETDECPLQVTLLKMDKEAPDVQLEAQWRTDGVALPAEAGGSRYQRSLAVTVRHSADVTVERLGCSDHDASVLFSRYWEGARLDQIRCDSSGQSQCFVLPPHQRADGALCVSVVVRDNEGRRASAHAVVPVAPSEPQSLQFASRKQ